MSILQKSVLRLIRFYQKWISLDQGKLSRLGIRICRYEPYCSEYSYQAIAKYGIIRGSLLSVYRVLRCNPFSKGGHDPVR